MSHVAIDYEIEFTNPKFADQYGRMSGYLTAKAGVEPYAAVRKSLGGWIRDNQRSGVTGGAVPKFRFLHLVVDGKQLAGLGERLVWCLHCEEVGMVRLDVDGDEECSNCGAGEWDLWGWTGPYEPGKKYLHLSAEMMKGTGGAR